jgi:hypothetical protein
MLTAKPRAVTMCRPRIGGHVDRTGGPDRLTQFIGGQVVIGQGQMTIIPLQGR